MQDEVKEGRVKSAATLPALSVNEFPWEKDPVSPETVEQHAYMCGQSIARLRVLLDDDSQDMIINRGDGPGNRLDPLKDYTVAQMKEEGVGSFGIFTAIEPEDLDLPKECLQ